MSLTPKNDWDFEVIREGEENLLFIYVENLPIAPSLEDSELIMARTVDILEQVSNVSKVIFTQNRDYEYDYTQTTMIKEIADLHKKVLLDKAMIGYSNFTSTNLNNKRFIEAKYAELQAILYKNLKADPIGAYVELTRIGRRERIEVDKFVDENVREVLKKYIAVIHYIISLLDKTRLVELAKPYLPGYKIGDRAVYRYILAPTIKPDFMFTKLMANYPSEGEEVDNYNIDEDTEVTIFKFNNSIKILYHVMPPEFKLSEDKYELLDTARKMMIEHKPKQEEFTNPERMRQVFANIGRDLLQELANSKGMTLRPKDIDNITEILVRYTVGFGLIEVLLKDENIQDIVINSPMGKTPMFIVHAKYGECYTNIIPTKNEAESWASKLRLISGRPLDEANPIIDTELELPGAFTRVSVIAPPLDPTGLAFAFRRHRDKPWTLPLFIKYKMINPMAAGLLSFFVDGTRAMLVAGTRSAGKSSLLSSLIVEIMRKYRVITIEDTLELPTKNLRDLGFNIQSMKVASALAAESTEVSADTGIRATLRLGDSALIIGEVRSKEAIALYEAMRIGAAANVVAGTIHGDSPYGVFDRVVNDIGIPKTSFKATDLIVTANPIKSADGLSKKRRVTQITEVRKHWNDDPLAENGFVDLMKYSAEKDELLISDELKNGDSEAIKIIAGNIKDFAGNWDAVWDNILLRAKTKEALVNLADQINDQNILEAGFYIKANDQFHLICEKIRDEVGSLESKRILFEWTEWLKREVKKKKYAELNEEYG